MNNQFKNKIRLYTSSPLVPGSLVTLDEQASHYLCNVMRLTAGTVISCFDGASGEFDAVIRTPHKKQTVLEVGACTREFKKVPDLWLLFAPVKKDKTDFIIEKAVELGVSRLIPVLTERTMVEKIRFERYRAQAVEAAEQCRRLEIPDISCPLTLSKVLAEWQTERSLFLMDETGNGCPAIEAFRAHAGPAAILIGPEGGFSPAEITKLYQTPFVSGVSLGPRILRAETAAAAALAVWQAAVGDWR